LQVNLGKKDCESLSTKKQNNNNKKNPGMVVHTCHSSNSGKLEIGGLGVQAGLGKKQDRPYLQNNKSKNGLELKWYSPCLARTES
jgi:hypothetical protein